MWKGRATIQLQKIWQSNQPQSLIQHTYLDLLNRACQAVQKDRKTTDNPLDINFPPLILTKAYEHGFMYVIDITVYDGVAEYELHRYRQTLGRFPSPGNDTPEEKDRYDVEL